jgi:NAD(P)-dependent dehydrogenase (short-subunit alcohol dehydrogenase family)
VKTLLLDVDDEPAVPFAGLALEHFGRVDALVNNGGYYRMGPLEGTSMEQVHRQYKTNIFSAAALIKAFLPASRTQQSGVIINIASLTAEQGYPYSSVHASSRAAVALLSESLNICSGGSYTETLEGVTNIRIYGATGRAILEMLCRVAGSGVPMTVLPEHLGEFTG